MVLTLSSRRRIAHPMPHQCRREDSTPPRALPAHGSSGPLASAFFLPLSRARSPFSSSGGCSAGSHSHFFLSIAKVITPHMG